MIHLKQEVEKFLNSNWCNSNDKEQNMQGRLYAYLMHFEQLGYTVEMETSVNDEHMISVFKQCERDLLADKKEKQLKTEMDILIYKKNPDYNGKDEDYEYNELYEVELKWYHDAGFHYFDRIEEYKKDIRFAKFLVEKARFNEAVSVLIVNPYKNTIPRRDRSNYSELSAFAYDEENLDKKSTLEIDDFKVNINWHELSGKSPKTEKCFYYIVSILSNINVQEQVANNIHSIYGGGTFRKWWEETALSKAWSQYLYVDYIIQPNVDSITAEVYKELDNQ